MSMKHFQLHYMHNYQHLLWTSFLGVFFVCLNPGKSSRDGAWHYGRFRSREGSKGSNPRDLGSKGGDFIGRHCRKRLLARTETGSYSLIVICFQTGYKSTHQCVAARALMGFLHRWKTWCWLARAIPPPPLQRSSKDLNRCRETELHTTKWTTSLPFSPWKEECRGEMMSNLCLKPQLLISLIFLCHGPTFTACRNEHLKNQFWN